MSASFERYSIEHDIRVIDGWMRRDGLQLVLSEDEFSSDGIVVSGAMLTGLLEEAMRLSLTTRDALLKAEEASS